MEAPWARWILFHDDNNVGNVLIVHLQHRCQQNPYIIVNSLNYSIYYFFHNCQHSIIVSYHRGTFIFLNKLSLQFNWLDFLREIFAETDVTITKDEPLITFKGPFFKDFSNMLATTDPKTIGKSFNG